MSILKLYIGDVVKLRKTHPCGSDQWKVERLGADVGIRCLRCGRYVLMDRVRFERRIRQFIQRPPEVTNDSPKE
jgi:hypothetical protein